MSYQCPAYTALSEEVLAIQPCLSSPLGLPYYQSLKKRRLHREPDGLPNPTQKSLAPWCLHGTVTRTSRSQALPHSWKSN
jgi:hypothetical protein